MARHVRTLTRGRFALLIAVVFALVAAAAFAVGVAVLDDDGPDTPPSRTTTGADSSGDPGGSEAATSTTTSPATSAAPADGPMWIAVVSSEGSEQEAQARAASVAAEVGLPTGVLRSDDYESLNPGLWVAYAGPYASSDEAEGAVDRLEDAGYDEAYERCAGTDEQCD